MKILVTYLPDDGYSSNIEINSDNIVVDGYDLTPRLRAMLNGLAFCLYDFFEEMRKENKC